ncbi:MAG TPA: agmatine deiminase family protein [Chthoniobacterales bacterium]|nr:agmatine deiminase family protein [Chthoniobacterales bacterium]
MSDFTANSPASLGYRLPAEWEPHEATWLSWPRREGISFPDAYDEVMPTFIQLVDALRGSEKVRINVSDHDHENGVRFALKDIDTSHIEFFQIPTNEPWCRDHGPIFIVRKDEPRLAIVDWDYNAWGGKYPPYDLDEVVPTKVAEQLKLPVYYPKLVMEGGSIDVNGAGSLLTTTSCLLNPNRNPNRSKSEIEQALRDYLGVRQIIWLGDGIAGDDTDGHIDDITRFVGPNRVITALEKDPKDPNYEPLQKNLELLKAAKLPDGSPLEIVTLSMPPPIEREGRRLPASYANFYIANKVVLLPVFGAPTDRKAASTLRKCFPGRKIVPIDCRALVWGLGAFHCLTQQQPAIGR